jgi:hypothetical protein
MQAIAPAGSDEPHDGQTVDGPAATALIDKGANTPEVELLLTAERLPLPAAAPAATGSAANAGTRNGF